MRAIGCKRIALILVLAAAFAVCCGLSFTAAGAEAPASAAVTFENYKMTDGADVRVAEDIENYGLRFTVRMPKTDYDAVMAENSGYNDVVFGVLIVPEDYTETYGELTEENVFGENSVYYWGEQPEDDKTRIINLYSDGLYGSVTENGAEYAVLKAAIIDIKDNNRARPFIGMGYAGYTDGEGTKHYVMLPAVTRSVAQVAAAALDGGETYTDEQIANITSFTQNLPFRLNLLRDGEAMEETAAAAVKAEILNGVSGYKGGETLDISAAAQSAKPDYFCTVSDSGSVLSAEIPLSGAAEFTVNYSSASTGNIVAPSPAALPEYISKDAAAYIATVDSGWQYWVNHTTASNAGSLKFSSEFTQGLIDNKLLEMNIEMRLDKCQISTQSEFRLYIRDVSVPETEEDFRIDLGGGVYSLSEEFSTLTVNLPFAIDEGDYLYVDRVQNTGYFIIKDITFNKLTTAGDISKFAATDGIVSSYLPNNEQNGQVFNYGENSTLYFNSFIESDNYMMFDSEYVQNMINAGLTEITVEYRYGYAMANGTSGTFRPRYYDASEDTFKDLSGASLFTVNTVPADGTTTTTVTFGLSAEDIAAMDFEGGDVFCLGGIRFVKGLSGGKCQLYVYHLEFHAEGIYDAQADN